jgi:hypothetical protein
MERILETSDVTVFAECQGRRGVREVLIRIEPKAKGDPVRFTSVFCGRHDVGGLQRTLKKLGQQRGGAKQKPWSGEFTMRTREPEGIAEETFTADSEPGKVVLRYDTVLINPDTGETIHETHCRTTSTHAEVSRMTRLLIGILDRCC